MKLIEKLSLEHLNALMASPPSAFAIPPHLMPHLVLNPNPGNHYLLMQIYEAGFRKAREMAQTAISDADFDPTGFNSDAVSSIGEEEP